MVPTMRCSWIRRERCWRLRPPTSGGAEDERLLTPTLEQPILAGITRAVLVELAPSAGFEVEEGVFRLERLAAADEVFLSSSVREVMAVTAIDGVTVGSGAPGPASQSLQRALRAAAATLSDNE